MALRKHPIIETTCTACAATIRRGKNLFNKEFFVSGVAFCNMACYRTYWVAKNSNNEEKFWKKVDKTPGFGPNGDCWKWTGNTSGKGYGWISWAALRETMGLGPGKNVLAHRVTYTLLVGPIPKGLDLLHSCDTPLCVNPAHLTPGTRKDNMQDAVSKGRVRTGENTAGSVLTAEQAEQIKIRHAAGYSYLAIQQITGLDYYLIRSVTVPTNWKSVAVQDDDPRVLALKPEAKEYMENIVKGSRPLSPNQIREIKIRLRDGESQASIARHFNCADNIISRIHRGKTWASVQIES